jgi:hypothetical protein
VLSGLVLVSYPLAMLQKFSLPIFEKRMLFVALLSSAFTLLLVLTLAIFTYGDFTKDINFLIIIYMLSHTTVSALIRVNRLGTNSFIQAALSLIACNMLVFMSLVIRKIRNHGKNNVTLQSWLRQADARDVPFVMGLQDPNPWPAYPSSQTTEPPNMTVSRAPNNLTVPTMSSYAHETNYIEVRRVSSLFDGKVC